MRVNGKRLERLDGVEIINEIHVRRSGNKLRNSEERAVLMMDQRLV